MFTPAMSTESSQVGVALSFFLTYFYHFTFPGFPFKLILLSPTLFNLKNVISSSNGRLYVSSIDENMQEYYISLEDEDENI